MMSTCCSKHLEAWNKHIEKECIKLVVIQNYFEMHGQQNIKYTRIMFWYTEVIMCDKFKYIFHSTAQLVPRPSHCWGSEIAHKHTKPVGLLWTLRQLVAKVATYITQNKHKRRILVPSARFGSSSAAVELPQNCVLDRTDPGSAHTDTDIYIYDRIWRVYSNRCRFGNVG